MDHISGIFGKWFYAATQKPCGSGGAGDGPLTVSAQSAAMFSPTPKRRRNQTKVGQHACRAAGNPKGRTMSEKLFALSLGFAGLILAIHAGFA
ncbi:MAG TPA: hypothetical protein VGA75_12920 [Paracoccaceae bacterium]